MLSEIARNNSLEQAAPVAHSYLKQVMNQRPWNPDDVPVKLYIHDILQTEQDPNDRNYYLFRGIRIRKVDVMGVVTEVRNFEDTFIYRVDDGSGEIQCRFKHHSPSALKERQEIEELQERVAAENYRQPSKVGAAKEFILEELFRGSTEHFSPFAQGDCVHLQGFISTFIDSKQINAFIMYKVDDPAHELDRIYELSALYSSVYTNSDR